MRPGWAHRIKCRIPNHLVRGDAEVRSCPEDNLALEGDADLDLEHTATICGARCRGTGKTGASPRGAGESGAHLGFQSSLRKRYDVGAGTLTGIVSTMEVTRSAKCGAWLYSSSLRCDGGARVGEGDSER